MVTRRPLIVGACPDRLGAWPGEMLRQRVDLAAALPSASLFGFLADAPSLEAMTFAAAELVDAGATDVIAIGLDVARAFGAPPDLKLLTWSMTASGARLAWVPPPRSRWWREDRREQVRRWLAAALGVPEDRGDGVDIVPHADPAPLQRRSSETVEMARRARTCLDAALAVTGVHPSSVRERARTTLALITWRMASYLSAWNRVRSEVMGELLGVSGSHVRVDATKFKQAALRDESVRRLAIQADLAYEVLDVLRFNARLEKSQRKTS